MKKCFGVFFPFCLLFVQFVEATLAPANCPEHVERIYQKRLTNLLDEGIITVDTNGQYKPLWTAEKLYKDPRFRNFPAISLQQIQWCPQMAAVESSISFLSKVGFHPQNIDTYFKRLLFTAENPEILVTKDQVGLSNGRIPFIDWADVDPLKKAFVANYAMAVHKDPLQNNKILARAGSTFLGIFQKKAIYTLPYHALALGEAEKRCEDFEFYFPKTPQKPLKAETTLLILPQMDIVFCALSLGEDHKSLQPATLDANSIPKGVRLMTYGVGTDPKTKKLQLTIDDSEECLTLVDESEGALYDSGALTVTTQRWAMGCDVSEGNSGDGVFNKLTGKWVAMVTSRAPFTYQTLAKEVFSSTLSKERLYMEASHFVPLSQIRKSVKDLPENQLSDLQKQWRNWFLAL